VKTGGTRQGIEKDPVQKTSDCALLVHGYRGLRLRAWSTPSIRTPE
jgi:hypothetical protein